MSNKKSAPKQVTQQSLAEQLFHAPISPITPIQEQAMMLYVLGLNVFPLPYGKKGGYPWQILQYTRLNPEDIYPLFRGWCNTGVMTGRTSGNLFVIDCETTAAFQYHGKLLREAEIPIWSVRTNGKRDGGHFYLRSSVGEVKNIKPGERKDYEVRGNRCYVLAPPSLHPDTRLLYQWHIKETPAPPEVSIAQLHWLGLTLTRESHHPRPPQTFANLSNETRDFILNGAVFGERNNRLFKAACDMVGNGYDQHTATQFLEPIALKIGLLERETRDTINSAFSKPRTPAKPEAARIKAPAAWEKALAWAEQQLWSGRHGQTDRAVFLACCERAKTANDKRIFRASAREIATLARMTPKTANKAVQRLVEAKRLIFCGKDKDSGAYLYRFGAAIQLPPSKILHSYHTTTTPGGGDSVVRTQKKLTAVSDAVERRALGKAAHTLYMAMIDQRQPLKAAVLAEWASLSIYQVYHALKKLLAFGLVVKTKTLYRVIPLTDEQLDTRVAEPAGVLGKGERRREQHRRERATQAANRLYKVRWGKGYTLDQQLSESVKYVCRNCGQVWQLPGLEPPLVCDFCGDAMTWQ